MPKQYKNEIVKWSYIDPDDPADDIENVDPNGPAGNDNGYLGTGEEYLPAGPPKFFDKYGFETNTSVIDTNGISLIYFEPSPSEYGWHHPGDNFIIKAIVRDSAVWSDIIYAWKRIKIEYDYMVSGKIKDISFNMCANTFSGKCFAGEEIDWNRNPYMYFNANLSIYLKIDNENLPDEIINASNVDSVIYFLKKYRNLQDTAAGSPYPVYLLGAYIDENYWGPRLGVAVVRKITSEEVWGSIVFVEKINLRYSFLSEAKRDTMIGFVLTHELGHQIGYILDDDPHLHPCIFSEISYYDMFKCEYQRFCPFCIYMLRGNIYRYERPIFKKGTLSKKVEK